eukprot:2952488-Rhodomonas_salina.1
MGGPTVAHAEAVIIEASAHRPPTPALTRKRRSSRRCLLTFCAFGLLGAERALFIAVLQHGSPLLRLLRRLPNIVLNARAH